MVHMYGVFRDKCKVRPAEILYTLIATAASNLIFSWVVRVGEFCHPELPGNAKIVYSSHFRFFLSVFVKSRVNLREILPKI